MPEELTDAAKKEIAEAIRIVREDRFEKYVRGHVAKPADPLPPPDPNAPPVTPPVTPPPGPDPNDPPNDPPSDKEYSRWWGEIIKSD